MGILQSVLGAFLGGGGVLENFLAQQGGISGGVGKGINYFQNQEVQEGNPKSITPEMLSDLNTPIPVGGVEGTNFIEYLLKLKYPYLFNNSGVR
jgi:hypothetical protein